MSETIVQDVIDERRGCTSASNALEDTLCVARFLAQKGIPDGPKGPDAETGRKIHALLAGEQGMGEMAALPLAMREMFDACRSIEKAQVLKYFGSENGKMKVFREQRYWVLVPDGTGGKGFEHSGKPDVVYRAGTKALIIEYKTLAGDIADSPDNLQLRDQAVLVRGNLRPIDEIATVVVQPLVTHSPVMCIYDGESLDRAEAEMFDRVRASHNPQALPTAGKPQCDFCKAKLRCAAYQQWAGSMVPGMLTLLDVPVASWTPEQRGVFCDKRLIAQKWLDECTDACKAILEVDPDGVSGWMLKAGAVKETIVDPQKVWDKFTLLGGKLEDFMGCIAVGKTKLKEAISKVTGAKGKKLEDALHTVTEGATETSQNKPSLARKE